jgi:hypothetical protein
MGQQNGSPVFRAVAGILALLFAAILFSAPAGKELPWAVILMISAIVLTFACYALGGKKGLPGLFAKEFGAERREVRFRAPIPSSPLRPAWEVGLSASGNRGTDHCPAWRSTAALVSFTLCVLSWELSAAMFAGRWLFGQTWFGPHREWAAFAVSVASSLFHRFIGRRLIRNHYQSGNSSIRSLSAGQAVAVTVLVIAGGAFGTWLFCRGPGAVP